MSTTLQLAALALAIALALAGVALPFVRPPAASGEAPEPPPRVASRTRLLRAVEELERDRRAGMITQADYEVAVGEIRRRLSRT